MFLKFYNLREQPFGTTPNPRYLYPSVVHREVLASLLYGIESNLGFAAVVAQPGMGKTTLLFRVLSRLRNSARTAFLFETQCDSRSLLRYLLAELGVTTTNSDPVVLHEKFKQVLYEESRIGRRVVVIIDEAQNLDAKVLETVRLLSDFETPDAKLLHIILAGQPRLAEQLARPELSQLLQRISIMNFLRPLELEEATEYIGHRLRIAGYSGPQLFTTPAMEGIAELSGGVPREINRICFNALSLGCALALKQIDRSLIDEVGADLDLGLLLKNLRKRYSVSVRRPVSIPDAMQQKAGTRSAEIVPVPGVKQSEQTTPDEARAGTEASAGQLPAKDTHRQLRRAQSSGSCRTRYSAAVDNKLHGLTPQQWEEEAREAYAYIQYFLARNKPARTPSDPD